MLNITYGIGGYCSDCDDSHGHPLNNIIAQEELPDPEPTPEEINRTSALTKLQSLGLTEEEVRALLNA
jgi:hypothetical protein